MGKSPHGQNRRFSLLSRGMRFTAQTRSGPEDFEVIGGALGASVTDLAEAAGIPGVDSAIDYDGSVIPTHTALRSRERRRVHDDR